MDNITEAFITQLQFDWKPKTHCSNCIHCVVFRDEDTEQLMAKCTSNMGKAKPLEQLINLNSKGWKVAIFCPGYVDMDGK